MGCCGWNQHFVETMSPCHFIDAVVNGRLGDWLCRGSRKSRTYFLLVRNDASFFWAPVNDHLPNKWCKNMVSASVGMPKWSSMLNTTLFSCSKQPKVSTKNVMIWMDPSWPPYHVAPSQVHEMLHHHPRDRWSVRKRYEESKQLKYLEPQRVSRTIVGWWNVNHGFLLTRKKLSIGKQGFKNWYPSGNWRTINSNIGKGSFWEMLSPWPLQVILISKYL